MSFYDFINEKNLNQSFQKPKEFETKKINYGTAGFRTIATNLDWVMYRMGLLACLRSVCKNTQYIGCMITASHNPQEDNGCKLVDPLGEMLEEKWESYATELVNSNDLYGTLKHLCNTEFKSCIDCLDSMNKQNNGNKMKRPNIVVGHDTRASCPLLLEAFTTGVRIFNGNLVNYGLLSTPQLHYLVRCLNTDSAYGEPTEAGYFNKMINAFFSIWSLIDFEKNYNYDRRLLVDGANGVGAFKSKMLAELLENRAKDNNLLAPQIQVFNDAQTSSDLLNHLCGADFVKVQQKPPNNVPKDDSAGSSTPIKYCSLDGDADRVVYYYMEQNEENNNSQKFYLLDGDKIATLIATHLGELLDNSNLKNELNMSIVQTAYANGASTSYIQDIMKINASCVPTGVKYLHHQAQKFDIGVYFEANGHGTVHFSPRADQLIDSRYKELIHDDSTSVPFEKSKVSSDKHLLALYQLKHLKDCINQTVGDAISDYLVVELILASRNMTMSDWNRLYTDLPSRQLKVSIKDRNQIKTYDAERRVSQPSELQDQLDKIISDMKCPMARSFVRPSGTEDVVRVYAEADTQSNADLLAKRVCQLVYDLAGGVGTRPF